MSVWKLQPHFNVFSATPVRWSKFEIHFQSCSQSSNTNTPDSSKKKDLKKRKETEGHLSNLNQQDHTWRRVSPTIRQQGRWDSCSPPCWGRRRASSSRSRRPRRRPPSRRDGDDGFSSHAVVVPLFTRRLLRLLCSHHLRSSA
jgi:hypothetical protein